MKKFKNLRPPLNGVDRHIDKPLKNLIKRLNNDGYGTYSSCQGRTKKRDDHTLHAFMSFECEFTVAFRKEIDKVGLHYYNGNSSICSAVFSDTPEDIAIEENSLFVTRMNQLFGYKE